MCLFEKQSIILWQCPSICLSICLSFQTFLPYALRYQFETWYIHSVGDMTCQVWVSLYPPQRSCGGGGGFIGFTLSVRLSFCPLTFRFRPVASTVQNGFFPYLVQMMINSMRGCVTCYDLWPRPISSRSFGLDLENRVRSVASTVLDGFFLYLTQMITIIRGCVECNIFFRIWKFEFLANFWNFSALTLKRNLQFSMDSFHI